MKRKRFAPENIILMLRGRDQFVPRSDGWPSIPQLGIFEQTYYRWRKQYGGMKISQAKRMKELERQNGRLKKAVSELTLDKLILMKALGGNY